MQRPATTFRKRGRMSATRRLAIAQHFGTFGLESDHVGEWEPTIVDIGFGMGESLMWLADRYPDQRVLGIEMHLPGIAGVVDELSRRPGVLVRLVRDDALTVLPRLAPRSLTLVSILHPDPWPKMSQRHRRMVQPDLIGLVADLLAPSGRLMMATDWADYADQMASVVAADARFSTDEPGDVPETKYGRLGAASGRPRRTMAFVRN